MHLFLHLLIISHIKYRKKILNFALASIPYLYIMKTTAVIFALLLGTVAATAQNGKGNTGNSHKIPALNAKYMNDLGLGNQKFTQKADGVWTTTKGITIYSSQPYATGIKGFGGSTPLFVAIGNNGKIRAIAPAANTETPEFWEKVAKSRLFKAWNGLTPAQAAAKKVDAVSGATYSSTAVIKTVQATVKKLKN